MLQIERISVFTSAYWAGVRMLLSSCGLVCLLLARLSIVDAQTLNTGMLRGQVVDAHGAAIRGAVVIVTNQVTGLKREARTDSGGYYTIASLPLTGQYRLEATSPGFAAESREGLELRAGEAATLNVTLAPKGTDSSVTIYGTVEGVRSDSPQLETRLDLQKIDETPIFGRKLSNLPLLNSAVKPARNQGDLFLNN